MIFNSNIVVRALGRVRDFDDDLLNCLLDTLKCSLKDLCKTQWEELKKALKRCGSPSESTRLFAEEVLSHE